MSTLSSFPTPYPEVNAILNILLSDVQDVLGNQFTGMYLHGSLAYGDFNPETSDIDFLAVTEDDLPIETFAALKEMHAGLFQSGMEWSQKLEGAYLPKEVLRRHSLAYPATPWLGMDGHFTPGNSRQRLDHPALDPARERSGDFRPALDRFDRSGRRAGFAPGGAGESARMVVAALSFPGKIPRC
jgi:hypothetical protein